MNKTVLKFGLVAFATVIFFPPVRFISPYTEAAAQVFGLSLDASDAVLEIWPIWKALRENNIDATLWMAILLGVVFFTATLAYLVKPKDASKPNNEVAADSSL